jgi:hypothetical protein
MVSSTYHTFFSGYASVAGAKQPVTHRCAEPGPNCHGFQGAEPRPGNTGFSSQSEVVQRTPGRNH